jgi:hypothetical protein
MRIHDPPARWILVRQLSLAVDTVVVAVVVVAVVVAVIIAVDVVVVVASSSSMSISPKLSSSHLVVPVI